MMRPLFPTDAASQAETMAAAFSFKNTWDLRWFRLKLLVYTATTFLATLLFTSLLEHMFNFSLWVWLFS